MNNPPFFIIDAFVGTLGERVLRGNPAAVVLLDEPRDVPWMQNIAAEMNLSETAFVVQKQDELFDSRWFTPLTEVKLCGHATLATAHALWECERLERDQIARFETQSGILTAKSDGEWIELDFPTQPTRFINARPNLAQAVGMGPHDPVVHARADDDWLLQVPVGRVEDLQPNFPALRQITLQLGLRGVIVTALAPADSNYDFVSRFFGPAVGVDEDPVTGSAHTKLAPFWGEQLNRKEMTGYQASKRGGIVRVSWRESRVGLSGRATIFARGHLEG